MRFSCLRLEAVIAFLAFTGIVPLAWADAGPGDPARGAVLYAEACAICHGVQGQGGVGPNLTDLKARRDLASTEAWIKDPSARMPKLFPTALSAQDVNDVAIFVNGF